MISVTVDDRSVQAALRKLSKSSSELSPVMNQIGAILQDSIKDSFKQSRDPWGSAWAPLSAVTAARRKGGKGGQPLLDTGRLRNSINYQANASSVVVGASAKYAGTHQFGAKKGAFGRTTRNSPIPWGDVPARPFVPISADGKARLPPGPQAEIIDTIGAHLMRAIRS